MVRLSHTLEPHPLARGVADSCIIIIGTCKVCVCSIPKVKARFTVGSEMKGITAVIGAQQLKT